MKKVYIQKRNNLPSITFLICTDTFQEDYVYAFPQVKVLPCVPYFFLYMQKCWYGFSGSQCPCCICLLRCCLWIPGQRAAGECMDDSFAWVTHTPFLHLCSMWHWLTKQCLRHSCSLHYFCLKSSSAATEASAPRSSLSIVSSVLKKLPLWDSTTSSPQCICRLNSPYTLQVLSNI